MDLNDKVLEFFNWYDISIQKDVEGNCLLILVTSSEKYDIMYNILSNCALRLKVYIDEKTKTYNLKLVFKYNTEKEIEFYYDTKLTSKEYPSLIWLTNGIVSYITVGVEESNIQNAYYYKKPLLKLDCLYYPN